MKPIEIPALDPQQLAALENLYRATRDARLRTRAQMVLLAAERRMTAAEITVIVRTSEETVRRWLKRYLAEGVEGLRDVPHPGAPRKVTEEYQYRELLVEAVKRRPRTLGLPFSLWTLRRLADYMAEQNRHPGGVRDRPATPEGRRYSPQPPPAHHHQPRSRVCPQKKAIEEIRDNLPEGDVFYYADEFNLSWMPTLRAMWSPKGQQVMISTPAQPKKRYGIGAVNYHSGETVVLIRRRKRRRETAELLEALLEKHPTGTVYIAWDNSNTHEDDEVEAVLRGAAGRLVLLYLPTYSPWLNPIEMLWRHFRREVTHCELFPTIKALVAAAYDFFERYNRRPRDVLSIIGSNPAVITSMYLVLDQVGSGEGLGRVRVSSQLSLDVCARVSAYGVCDQYAAANWEPEGVCLGDHDGEHLDRDFAQALPVTALAHALQNHVTRTGQINLCVDSHVGVYGLIRYLGVDLRQPLR